MKKVLKKTVGLLMAVMMIGSILVCSVSASTEEIRCEIDIASDSLDVINTDGELSSYSYQKSPWSDDSNYGPITISPSNSNHVPTSMDFPSNPNNVPTSMDFPSIPMYIPIDFPDIDMNGDDTSLPATPVDIVEIVVSK